MGVDVIPAFLVPLHFLDTFDELHLQIGVGYNSGILFMQDKNADYELFFRPFTLASWIAISFLVGFSIVYAIGVSLWVRGFMVTSSFKILMTSLAYFFVLLNAYYGGAMTMFFTTEVTVPFQTMADVLAHPDWRVIFTEGDSVPFRNRLPSNNKDVEEYWSKYEADPSGFTVPSLMEGIQQAKTQRVVFHRDINSALYAISNSKANMHLYGDVKVIDKKIIRYYAMLPPNSPLTPSLSMMYIALTETGLANYAFKEWFGSFTGGESAVDLMRLSGGQMSSLFLILVGAVILSVLTLLYEVTSTQFKAHRKNNKASFTFLK